MLSYNWIGRGLVMMLVLLFGALGCGKDSSKTTTSQKTTVKKQVQTAQKQETQAKPKKKVWPYLEENNANIDLAKNLTAKNYVLIFDGSGSMNDSKCSQGRRKIDVAKEAVIQWSKTIPEDANLGLVAFNQTGWVKWPIGSGTRAEFMNLINKIQAGGGTPLSGAMKFASEDLAMQGKRQLGYGDYAIVIVTDGIANDPKILSQWVDYILAISPIQIYTIGFCIGKDHSLNQPGRTEYKAADNPQQLSQGLKEVLAESETFDDADFK